MKVLVFGFVLLCLNTRFPAFCQDSAENADSQNTARAQVQDQPAPQDQAPSPQEQAAPPPPSNRSVIGVTPGTEALKEKDLYERSGYLHPFRRMTRFVAKDQERIWTSPFHTSKSDAKWWAIFGGATAGLIAFDARIQRNAPSPSGLVTLGTDGSYLGASYTLIPISAGFYLIGSKAQNERFREAGLLSFETLANTTLLETILKVITDRQRPTEGSGEGHFFRSSDRLNSSFPSGHSINTFGIASVFIHEYHDLWWVKALAYAYAGGVAGARMAANRHFPADTLAGAVMGWFIGDYVYGKRHNPQLDKRSTIQKVLAHVRIGGPIY